jgi:hypothetical protein
VVCREYRGWFVDLDARVEEIVIEKLRAALASAPR